MPSTEPVKHSLKLACPSTDLLRQYMAGWIEESQAADIDAHLQSCNLCELTFKELEGHPETLLQSLQSTIGHTESKDDRADQANIVTERSQAREEENSSIDRALQNAKKLIEATTEAINDKAKSAWGPTIKELGIYDLIRPLGRGGMGAVYLAVHRQLRRQVAIKLLPLVTGEDSDVRARFEREIRVVGKLNHPSIVAATDAGEIDGTQFLVMEYVPGLDLSRLSRLLGRLSIADSCELIRQVAMGLSCAHSEGVVHRDVKPSNLMLDESGRIRILDFGLAQLSVWDEASVDLTTVGQLMGTLDYMAPEQAELSGNVDYRADLYALGATLFRLLCGRPPLAAAPNQSPLEKLRLLANHQPPKLATLCPEAPPELVQLVALLLSKNPQDRPASAAHVAEQLAPFAAGAKLVELLEKAKQKAAATPEPLKRSLVGESPATPPQAVVAHSASQTALQTDKVNDVRNRNVRRLLSATLLPLFIIAGILIKLETGKGQLVIDSEVDGVAIKLLQNGQPINGIQVSHGTTSTRLQADNYEITIDGASDGLEIINNQFTLKSGETVIAKIQRTVESKDSPSEMSVQSRVRSTNIAAPSDPIEATRYKLYELDVERQLLELKLGANHPQVIELGQEIEIRNAHLQELMNERDKASDRAESDAPLYDGKPLAHWLDTLSREKSAAGLKTAFDACSALATEENGEQIASVVLEIVPTLSGELNLEADPAKGTSTVDWVAFQLLRMTLPGPKFCSHWVEAFEAGKTTWRARLWKAYTPGTSALTVEDAEPFVAWAERRLLQNPAEGIGQDLDSLKAADRLRDLISTQSPLATDVLRHRVIEIFTISKQLPISWWLSQPLVDRSGGSDREIWPKEFETEVIRRAIEALQNEETSPSLVVQASMILLAHAAKLNAEQQQLISEATGRRLEAIAKNKSRLTQMAQTADEFTDFSIPLLDSQSPLWLTPIQIEVRRSWVQQIPVIENSVALSLLNLTWKLDKGASDTSQLDQIFASVYGTFERIQTQIPKTAPSEEPGTARSRGFGRMVPVRISILWPDLITTDENSQAFAPVGPANMKQLSQENLWGKHEPTKEDWLEYFILLHPVMTERVNEAIIGNPESSPSEPTPVKN